MTGFVSDWKHFFELRTAENAHPEMRRLTIPLKEEFIKRSYIYEN
jgi:thymidylate synthase ThyX